MKGPFAALFSFAVALSVQGAPSRATTACFPLDTMEPWNRPAPTIYHAQTGTYSQWLWNSGSDRPGNFNVKPGYAVYMSQDADAEYQTSTGSGNLKTGALKFNSKWKAFNTDGQIIVVAPDNRFTYEFFSASVDIVNRVVLAARGDYLKVDTYDIYGHGGNPGSRGIGIPYISMLVLDCEIIAGRINHALSFRVARPRCHEAWYPATKVENHPDCIDSGMPEGARFVMRFPQARIDAWALGLRQKGGGSLERFGRALAKALQVYGFYVTDNGGQTGAFDIQHHETWSSSNSLKSLATSNPNAIRDILDGLIRESDLSLIVEQGPRLYR